MRFTVRTKFILSFGIIILLSVFLGVYSIFSVNSVKNKSSEITDVWFLGTDLAHTMDTAISDYRIKEYKHIEATDKKIVEETGVELKESKDKFEKALNEYERISVLQEEKDIISTIKIEYPKFIEMSNNLLQLSNEEKDKEALDMLYGESKIRYDNVNNNVAKLVKLCQEQADAANHLNITTYGRVRLTLIIVVIVIVILSIAITIYMTNGISKPMKIVIDVLDKTSKFDFVYDEKNAKDLGKYKDEFGDMGIALIKMREALRELVDNIKQNSIRVSTNSDNLSSVISESSQSIEGMAQAMDEMAQGSTDLAKNVQNGASKLEVLAGEINQVANGSELMKEYITKTSNANKDGMEYIEKLKETVKANNEVAVKVSTQVDVLNKKSESIGKITDTIKSITAQINLLSLNAAIEAARAGEQGRGFAVVADEIRKLASETSNSTKEIDSIINELKKDIGATKSEITKAAGVINQTSEVSQGTEKAFIAINHAISQIISQIDSLISSITNIDNNKNEVVSNISDISAIAEESASTTEEVSASIQEQSAGIEQISQSANELKTISKELQELISKFRT
jgi:methyl-accepting chemotaxis protein